MMNFIISNLSLLASDCTLLGDELTGILKDIFSWIMIAIPVLTVVLCTVDLTKAVIAQDDGAIKKAQSTCIKRIMIGVALFFVPLLLNLFLSYGGSIVGTCGIGG